MNYFFLKSLFLALAFASPRPLPGPPPDPNHPGSKIYTYDFQQRETSCLGRAVNVFLPVSHHPKETFPIVVYGHGQALGLTHYQGTLEHLAKKGIIAVLPTYDDGFFDQDWQRMAKDYVNMTACALKSTAPSANLRQIVFAGHSKGAYVASIAAGITSTMNLPIKPKALVLFDPAGADLSTLPFIEPTTALTVVFADSDTTVSPDISNTMYSAARCTRKQIILLKSYTSETSTELVAGHMWPLTKSFFGTNTENAFHYYGEWKWLVAAALDLNTFLYGTSAADKGVSDFSDEIIRNF